MSEQLSRRSFDPAQVFNYYAATRGVNISWESFCNGVKIVQSYV